jgi:hypothetical protein
MNWLYNFPDVVILLLFVGLTLITMKVLHRVLHHFIKSHIPEEGHKLATHIHESIVILTSLILTFSLVQVLDDTHTLEKVISTEASQINNLDRLLTRFGDPTAEAIRPALHAYTKSIVEDEWPDLIKGYGSEITREKFIPVSQGVIKLKPRGDREIALYTSAINLTDQIAQSRELRIETTDVRLPSIYWYVILVAFLVKLLTSSLLERGKYGSFVLGLQMTALSAMLALVFIFDQPYQGQSGVKPGPLKRLIKVMDERHSELPSLPKHNG